MAVQQALGGHDERRARVCSPLWAGCGGQTSLVTALGWHGPVSARAGVTSFRAPSLPLGRTCPRLVAAVPSSADPSNGGGRAEAQAAHIQPVAENGPDSLRNGVALSSTFHWMFDRGLIFQRTGMPIDREQMAERQATAGASAPGGGFEELGRCPLVPPPPLP